MHDSQYGVWAEDDPRGQHNHEQLHAEAVDTLRSSQSFVLFAHLVDKSTDETTHIRTDAGFLPGVSRSSFMDAMTELLWRMYFQVCMDSDPDGAVRLGDVAAASRTFTEAGIEVLMLMRREDNDA